MSSTTDTTDVCVFNFDVSGSLHVWYICMHVREVLGEKFFKKNSNANTQLISAKNLYN